MKKKENPTTEEGSPSELFTKLNHLTNSNGTVRGEDIDSRLLWMVVCILAARRASVQIGVTRDGSAWSVQYWDGKFPVKYYFNTTDELNRGFAALIRAAKGRDVDNELNEILMLYGW